MLKSEDNACINEMHPFLAHPEHMLLGVGGSDGLGCHPGQLPSVGPFVPESIAERPFDVDLNS